MKYNTILFDADNTILDFDKAEFEALRRAFADHGIEIDQNLVDIYRKNNIELWQQLEKGLVTNALEALIQSGEEYDQVITIGPLVMMKFVAALTKRYEIPTVCSMNPVMVDGTGMCGGCRLTVGGKTKFACVDGPDFNAHEVDFDEAIARSRVYADHEKRQREAACNLLNKEVK